MLPSSATQSPVAGWVGCYFVTDSSIAKPSNPSKPFIHVILLRLLASSSGDKGASRPPHKLATSLFGPIQRMLVFCGLGLARCGKSGRVVRLGPYMRGRQWGNNPLVASHAICVNQ